MYCASTTTHLVASMGPSQLLFLYVLRNAFMFNMNVLINGANFNVYLVFLNLILVSSTAAVQDRYWNPFLIAVWMLESQWLLQPQYQVTDITACAEISCCKKCIGYESPCTNHICIQKVTNVIYMGFETYKHNIILDTFLRKRFFVLQCLQVYLHSVHQWLQHSSVHLFPQSLQQAHLQ